MRMSLNRYLFVFRKITVVSCAGLLALLPLQTAIAVDPADGWLAPGNPVVKFTELPAGYVVPDSINFNTDCDTRNFDVITREAKAISAPPFSQTELRRQSNCAIMTPRGLHDGVFLDAGVPAGRFTGHSGSVALIPNSKTLMSLRTISAVSMEVAFYKAIVPAYNNVSGEVTFNLVDRTVLKDRAGNQLFVRPGSVGYSSDGRWMVADSPLGFIRVDLNDSSKPVLPFASGLSGYGTSLSPFPRVAVSSDGKYAAIASRDSLFKIFDLTTCAAVPDTITGPVACQHKDVLPFLAGTFNSYLVSYYIRFASPDLLTFITDYRDASGAGHRMSVRMAPSGQTIEDVNYLALGDSFSSGEGELNDEYYEMGTNEPENKCHLSRRSYTYLISQIFSVTDFHSVACSGAIMADYQTPQSDRAESGPSLNNTLGDWLPGPKSQHEFVRMAGDSEVITISMSGNDLGFADKLQECVTTLGTCDYAGKSIGREKTAKEVASLYARLKKLYEQMIADTDSKTKIFVIGYPQIVSPSLQCDSNVHLNSDEAIYARKVTTYMNQVIRAAASSSGVYYVDIEGALEGSNLCSGNPRSVNGLTAGDDITIDWWQQLPAKLITDATSFGNESYHPNAKGHELMASAIINALDNNFIGFDPCPAEPDGIVICPQSGVQIPLPDESYFGASAVDYVSWLNNPTVNSLPPGEDLLFRLQDLVVDSGEDRQVRIRQDTNLKPGSIVKLELRSDPVDLGSYAVDQYGSLEVVVTIPESVAAGRHTIHLLGESISGEIVDYYQPVIVVGEEGDLDEDDIPDHQDPCGFVEASNTDQDRDGIDDACDAEITDPPADTIPPEVTATPDRGPNEHGWYNGDITINWTTTDPEPSSGVPTLPSATVVNQEGIQTYTSEPSCDPLNNCATGSIEIKLDKTGPTLGTANWANNPKSIMGSASLSVSADDNLSGVAEAEYYLGDTDPGLGNGATMQVNDGAISVDFNTDFPTGVYKVTVRAKDVAGNWGQPTSDYLVVYDPLGTRMTGKRTLIPNLNNGDILPGLIDANQEDKAKFGFNVRYDQDGQIHKNSDFQFKYETGTRCNRPPQATNCHSFELNATSISWLTTQGVNDSAGIFQGTAKLGVDSVHSIIIFRLEGLDGERLDNTNQDHLTLKVYAEGGNPNTDTPKYHVNAEVVRGNIKIHNGKLSIKQ